ncbi:MAG TPA: hypothetical protein DEH78_06685, partial [Solibacterales bacterium]|nr:hypothetical protein [Bryobacterales bacterium]
WTGRTHGVVHQGGIAVLAELMIRFGTEFSRSPDKAWAWKMLAKPSLPGEVKVAALRERMEAATGGRRIVA